MARWRLTPHGSSVLAEWEKDATTAHRQRLAEVLETIGDGSWKDRWWNRPYAADESITEIRAGDGLIIHATGLLDETNDIVWVDLSGVWGVEDDEADLRS